jgi:Flp pilus assembly protein TadG
VFFSSVKRWFSTSVRGNVALISALMAAPLTLAVVFGVEGAGISNDRTLLQAAVDGGALAGANGMGVVSSGSDTGAITSIAQTQANAAIANTPLAGKTRFDVTVDSGAGVVTVSAVAERPPMLGVANIGNAVIKANATAESLRNTPLCILQFGTEGLHVQDQAKLTATGCLVHANGDLQVESNAMVTAGVIQTAGTATGTTIPAANGGALKIPDPFVALNVTPPSTCPATKKAKIITSGSGVLNLPAGVHCEEIKMLGTSKLILAPGEHYFMEELSFNGNSSLEGTDVVLIFGNDDSVGFGDRATVNISARTTGPFAGFLIATTRTNKETFLIASDNVRELLGTIYIPNALLIVSTAGKVAQDSAWSVIVAKELSLAKNPDLVINKAYAGSGVPVPKGVGPSGSSPRLTQ